MKYTIVPRAEGPFRHCDALTRMAFGLLWDRYQLSHRTVTYQGDSAEFYDELWDDVYCIYTADQLAADLDVCERTARRCLGQLRAAQIIDWRRASFAGANRIFFSRTFRVWMASEGISDGTP